MVVQDEKKTTGILPLILVSTGVIKEHELSEAVQAAHKMNVPLARALVMMNYTSESSLQLPLEAEHLAAIGQITPNLAVKAVRLAKENKMPLIEAVHVLKNVHRTTTNLSAFANQYSELMLAAEIITQEQLGRAYVKSQDTQMQLSRTLILDRDTTSNMLSAAIHAQILISENKITREQAIKALKIAKQRHVTLEQILFEQGIYMEQPNNRMRLGELFAMAGYISEMDMLECLEIESTKHKEFDQILLEYGFVSAPYLEAAAVLQNMVARQSIKPYEAAELLKQIRNKDVSVNQAVVLFQQTSCIEEPCLRIGDLLVLVDIVDRETVEKVLSGQQIDEQGKSNIKLGRLLLTAGLVSESALYNALRCLSLLKQGYLSNEQAVKALKFCVSNEVTPDEALPKLGYFPPTRMQWIWV